MPSYGRTRTIDTYKPTYWTWRNHYTNVPAIPDYVGTAAANREGSSSTMKDTNHPRYSIRRRNGEILASDMSLIRSSRSYTSGSVIEGPVSQDGFLGKAGSTCTHTGDMLASIEGTAQNLISGDVMSSDLSRMGQIALAKAYAKMNQSTLLSGEIIHDLDQTVRMLRRPFAGAVDLLKRMHKYRRRINAKTYTQAVKAAADTWLEYRYGWKPLLLDCDAIIDLAVQKRSRDWRALVVRSSESQSFSQTVDFSNLTFSSVWKASGTLQRERVVKAHAGIMFRSVETTDFMSETNRILGTRPRDLAVTAWEIIPYSFVVDWFVNVGTWIEAVVPNPDVEVITSWLTTVNKVTDKFGATLTVTRSYPPTKSFSGSGGTSEQSYSNVDRVVGPVLSNTPVLTTQRLSMTHTADLQALLTQQVIPLMKKLDSRVDRRVYTD